MQLEIKAEKSKKLSKDKCFQLAFESVMYEHNQGATKDRYTKFIGYSRALY